MTTSWTYWKNDLAKRLSDVLGGAVSPDDIVVPPDRSLGDFAFGCFKLAKAMGKSPADIAKEIASKMNFGQSDFTSASAAGPYVNFTLSVGEAVHRVVRDIEVLGEKYGSVETKKADELLLEFAQPNTHKEIHVGHLRNLVLGQALSNVLSAAGWKVVPMSYHGDVGAHVAKCLWWLGKGFRFQVSGFSVEQADKLLDQIPVERRTGKFLGEMYAEASRQLEANPEWKDEVSDVQRKLEAHDPAWEKLWRETRRWSLDEFATIFDDLGVKIARQYLESEVVDRGQEMVDHLLKQGVAKESQGAIVVDLEDKKLGVFLIRKSDGTSLYATKDLALAELKLKEYPKAERSLILVDNRQSFYFKQLFETLRMLELNPVPEFVGYEFVTLKSGAMSSREGNVVTYQDFRNEVISYSTEEVVKRHAEDKWNDGKIEHTAWCIAMAGMKFGMLKQDNDKVFTFDLEQALSFDGDTGPYCQYAATRLASILRKAGSTPSDSPFVRGREDEPLTRSFDHTSEKALALTLAQFPVKVAQAAEELRPSLVAQWCIDAAQRVNEFYRDVNVLESEGELKEGRLRLIAAARSALVAGLGLLAIPVPDEM
ncbi:arginine--tRNA ligase [Candidatus Uhrbacteria bacterium]|nr:MAG: arginine--tRNA ligase [Candidatus Uhrbacteria bacterium]